MPQNLEIKVKLTSFNKIKDILKQIGAVETALLEQKDVYYKHKPALLKLRCENNRTQLIQYKREESKTDRFSDYSYIELSRDAEKFLAKVLEVEAVVEKSRELYLYKNTRIHLDKVKGLGNFLELETLVLNGKADARKRFNELVTLLELDTKSQFLCSYKDLLMKKKKAKSKPATKR